MDFIEGSQLIIKAFEKRAEERAFTLYTTKYAWMDEENYISFDEFYKADKQEDDRPIEEILETVRDVLNTNRGGWTT